MGDENPNGAYIAPPEELQRKQARIMQEVNDNPIARSINALRDRIAQSKRSEMNGLNAIPNPNPDQPVGLLR